MLYPCYDESRQGYQCCVYAMTSLPYCVYGSLAFPKEANAVCMLSHMARPSSQSIPHERNRYLLRYDQHRICLPSTPSSTTTHNPHYGWATMHSSFRRSQCSLNWRTDHGNIHLNQRRIQEFQKHKHRYKTKIWLKKILLCK